MTNDMFISAGKYTKTKLKQEQQKRQKKCDEHEMIEDYGVTGNRIWRSVHCLTLQTVELYIFPPVEVCFCPLK